MIDRYMKKEHRRAVALLLFLCECALVPYFPIWDIVFWGLALLFYGPSSLKVKKVSKNVK